MNIVAYTGGLMSVSGWGPVAIDLAGIDASAEQVGILADLDSRLSGIVGHGRAVVANGRLLKAPASGFTLVRAGVLKEVSIVAIGADADTSVSIAATRNKENGMTATETTTLTADQVRAEALAETNRITAIRKACGGRHGDIEARAIKEGWDGPRTELEVLRASRPIGPAIYSHREPATRTVLEAAILAHMGCESLAEKRPGADAAHGP